MHIDLLRQTKSNKENYKRFRPPVSFNADVFVRIRKFSGGDSADRDTVKTGCQDDIVLPAPNKTESS